MSSLVTARRPAPRAGIPGRARDDAVTLAGSLVLVAGLFADGVVHNRADSDLESFVTVPHTIIFVGFLLTGAWLLTVLHRHHRNSPAAAWPAGYRLSVVGLLAFAAGFVGDSIWHSLFGIEADIEALLSPTHLAMFVGGVLLLLTPARRAWALLPAGARLGWRQDAGLLGSVTLATMVIAFFTQFAWALSATVPARPLVPRAGVAEVLLLEELERAYGIAAILLTTVVLLVPAVVLQRRWVLPVGATALVWTTTAAGLALFRVGHHPLATVLAAAAAGLVFDLAGRLPGPWGTRLAAATGPGVLWAAYFTVLATAQGLRWPPELWAGSTVLASLAGVALAAATGPGAQTQPHRQAQ